MSSFQTNQEEYSYNGDALSKRRGNKDSSNEGEDVDRDVKEYSKSEYEVTVEINWKGDIIYHNKI